MAASREISPPCRATLAPPRPNNILEWHFVITGPEATPYEGGQYHGMLLFPADYPYKPPAIMMASGRKDRSS